MGKTLRIAEASLAEAALTQFPHYASDGKTPCYHEFMALMTCIGEHKMHSLSCKGRYELFKACVAKLMK